MILLGRIAVSENVLMTYWIETVIGARPYKVANVLQVNLADDSEAFSYAEEMFEAVKGRKLGVPHETKVYKHIGTVSDKGTFYEREA